MFTVPSRDGAVAGSASETRITGTRAPPLSWSGTLSSSRFQRHPEYNHVHMGLPRVPRWSRHVAGSHSSPRTSGGAVRSGSRMATCCRRPLLLSWGRCTRFRWTWNTSGYTWDHFHKLAWFPGRPPSVPCRLPGFEGTLLNHKEYQRNYTRILKSFFTSFCFNFTLIWMAWWKVYMQAVDIHGNFFIAYRSRQTEASIKDCWERRETFTQTSAFSRYCTCSFLNYSNSVIINSKVTAAEEMHEAGEITRTRTQNTRKTLPYLEFAVVRAIAPFPDALSPVDGENRPSASCVSLLPRVSFRARASSLSLDPVHHWQSPRLVPEVPRRLSFHQPQASRALLRTQANLGLCGDQECRVFPAYHSTLAYRALLHNTDEKPENQGGQFYAPATWFKLTGYRLVSSSHISAPPRWPRETEFPSSPWRINGLSYSRTHIQKPGLPLWSRYLSLLIAASVDRFTTSVPINMLSIYAAILQYIPRISAHNLRRPFPS